MLLFTQESIVVYGRGVRVKIPAPAKCVLVVAHDSDFRKSLIFQRTFSALGSSIFCECCCRRWLQKYMYVFYVVCTFKLNKYYLYHNLFFVENIFYRNIINENNLEILARLFQPGLIAGNLRQLGIATASSCPMSVHASWRSLLACYAKSELADAFPISIYILSRWHENELLANCILISISVVRVSRSTFSSGWAERDVWQLWQRLVVCFVLRVRSVSWEHRAYLRWFISYQ